MPEMNELLACMPKDKDEKNKIDQLNKKIRSLCKGSLSIPQDIYKFMTKDLYNRFIEKSYSKNFDTISNIKNKVKNTFSSKNKENVKNKKSDLEQKLQIFYDYYYFFIENARSSGKKSQLIKLKEKVDHISKKIGYTYEKENFSENSENISYLLKLKPTTNTKDCKTYQDFIEKYICNTILDKGTLDIIKNIKTKLKEIREGIKEIIDNGNDNENKGLGSCYEATKDNLKIIKQNLRDHINFKSTLYSWLSQIIPDLKKSDKPYDIKLKNDYFTKYDKDINKYLEKLDTLYDKFVYFSGNDPNNPNNAVDMGNISQTAKLIRNLPNDLNSMISFLQAENTDLYPANKSGTLIYEISKLNKKILNIKKNSDFFDKIDINTIIPKENDNTSKYIKSFTETLHCKATATSIKTQSEKIAKLADDTSKSTENLRKTMDKINGLMHDYNSEHSTKGRIKKAVRTVGMIMKVTRSTIETIGTIKRLIF